MPALKFLAYYERSCRKLAASAENVMARKYFLINIVHMTLMIFLLIKMYLEIREQRDLV